MPLDLNDKSPVLQKEYETKKEREREKVIIDGIQNFLHPASDAHDNAENQ